MNRLILTLEFPEAPENFEALEVINHLSSNVKELQNKFQTTVNYEWTY
jgi:hypothetical protein